MRIRVQFTAQLRTAIGRPSLELELPEGSSVAELIESLAARFAEAKSHLLTADGQPHRSLLIVVNDAAVCSVNAVQTQLRPGDAVTLMPPIAGG
jgi:molybdopterin synthase sulfur carrier subunit